MTSSETHECMFQEELSSSQTATWGEKLFPLLNTHPCQNCNIPKQEEEWLHSDSELALLLSSCSPLLFPQMLTQTYPREASQNQSDQLLHVWERRGTVAVPDVGTASIQDSPYRHTGINDIFTHAQQYAVEMVSELDRLVTNKNRGESVLTVTWGTLRNKRHSATYSWELLPTWSECQDENHHQGGEKIVAAEQERGVQPLDSTPTLQWSGLNKLPDLWGQGTNDFLKHLMAKGK